MKILFLWLWSIHFFIHVNSCSRKWTKRKMKMNYSIQSNRNNKICQFIERRRCEIERETQLAIDYFAHRTCISRRFSLLTKDGIEVGNHAGNSDNWIKARHFTTKHATFRQKQHKCNSSSKTTKKTIFSMKQKQQNTGKTLVLFANLKITATDRINLLLFFRIFARNTWTIEQYEKNFQTHPTKL